MLFSSFWKRGPGPPLWGPGGSLDPWTPPPPLDPPQPRHHDTTTGLLGPSYLWGGGVYQDLNSKI